METIVQTKYDLDVHLQHVADALERLTGETVQKFVAVNELKEIPLDFTDWVNATIPQNTRLNFWLGTKVCLVGIPEMNVVTKNVNVTGLVGYTNGVNNNSPQVIANALANTMGIASPDKVSTWFGGSSSYNLAKTVPVCNNIFLVKNNSTTAAPHVSLALGLRGHLAVFQKDVFQEYTAAERNYNVF